MNIDNFLINEQDIENARRCCSYIDDVKIRNRAVANTLASIIAKKYFSEIDIDIDATLHRIDKVLADFDISDIYVKNCYVDVRLYFENEFPTIPKEHFERNIIPTAYMFVRMSKDLTGALVTGFFLPENIENAELKENYYLLSEDDLVSYYDIEMQLVNYDIENVPDDITNQIYEYFDGLLENSYEFYKVLIESEYCRKLFIKVALTETVLDNIDLELSECVISESPQSDTLIDDNEVDFGLVESDDLTMSDDNELDLVSSEDLSLNEEENDFGLVESGDLTMSDDNELDLVSSEDLSLNEEENDLGLVESDDLTMSDDNELDLVSSEDLSLNEEENDFGLVESDDLTMSDDVDDNVNTEFTAEVNDEQNQNMNLSNEFNEISNEILSDDTNENISEVEEVVNDESLLSLDDFDSLVSSEVENQKFEEEQVVESEPVEFNSDEENATSEELSQLFDNMTEGDEEIEEDFVDYKPKNKNNALPLLGVLVLVAGLGYWSYTKFFNNTTVIEEKPKPKVVKTQQKKVAKKSENLAMPIETIENTPKVSKTDEGNAMSIPAIEQSLDASVLVSNLSINWEVPASYLSNSSAKRYFTKMGKIIQLNLKTELLLLSTPPVTNKIAVELEFDSSANKFKVKEITKSSGEKVVDDLITQTINRALNINLKANVAGFATNSANPTLIIRL